MKHIVRSLIFAGLALFAVGSTARAGPFGYFTMSMARPGCLYCDCAKPYNAFTPPGYNSAIHQVAPSAQVYPGSGSSVAPSGCAGCGGNLYPANVPLTPIPAGGGYSPYP